MLQVLREQPVRRDEPELWGRSTVPLLRGAGEQEPWEQRDAEVRGRREQQERRDAEVRGHREQQERRGAEVQEHRELQGAEERGRRDVRAEWGR